MEQSKWQGESVKFIYPSSIAAYGLPSLDCKNACKVREDQYTEPTTMYGCNKLYCETWTLLQQGYRQLAVDFNPEIRSIFACVSGLISAQTIPTGGTSDYRPEMLHAAAKGVEYNCFVRPDAVLPFMVMPDAVKSLIMLERCRPNQIEQSGL